MPWGNTGQIGFILKVTQRFPLNIGFLRKYTEFYNKRFPLKFCGEKSLTTLRNPWLTSGLLKSVETKARLYQLLLKRPTHERDSNHNKFKNKLICLIRVARRNYYNKKLDMARSNLKIAWKILNEVINR